MAPQAAEARKEVLETYSADPLGLRGPQWNGSIAPTNRNGKYGVQHASERLTNSLRPEHINPNDFRTTKALFQPSSTAPAEFNRSTREWGITAHNWNQSTLLETPEEAAKRRQTLTAHCQQQTASKTMKLTGMNNYKNPVQRHEETVAKTRQKVGCPVMYLPACIVEPGCLLVGCQQYSHCNFLMSNTSCP
eukprot:365679-Chlamydomonas_euryale.AAC.19